MSFGFSPNDVIGLITLTTRTYKGWRSACSDYTDITGTLDCLYLLLRRLETHIPAQATSEPQFAQKEALRRDLATVIRGVESTVDDLGGLLEKFPSLGRSRSKNWERIRFGAKDLNSLRNRLTQHVSSISAFLNVVELESIGRLDQNISSMPDIISQRVTVALGNFIDAREADNKSAKGETVLTSYSNDDADVWKRFRSECVKSGIKSDDLQKFEPQLRDFILSIVEGRPASENDSRSKTKNGGEKGRSPSSSREKLRASNISPQTANEQPSENVSGIPERNRDRSRAATKNIRPESLSLDRPRTPKEPVQTSPKTDISPRDNESVSDSRPDPTTGTSPQLDDSAPNEQPGNFEQKEKHTKQTSSELTQRPQSSSSTSSQLANVVRRKANFKDSTWTRPSPTSPLNDQAISEHRKQIRTPSLKPSDGVGAYATDDSFQERSSTDLSHEVDVPHPLNIRLDKPSPRNLERSYSAAKTVSTSARSKQHTVHELKEHQNGHASHRAEYEALAESAEPEDLEAAVTEIAGTVRSRNRCDRGRSKNQGPPLSGSGIGGAALAGLYEKGCHHRDPKRHRSSVLRPSDRPSGEDLLKRFHSLQEIPGRFASDHSRKNSLSRMASANMKDDVRSTPPTQSKKDTNNQSLKNVKTKLPVQSNQSNKIAGSPSPIADLTIPPTPKPPDRPSLLGKDVDANNWSKYATAFGGYIEAFQAYDAALLQHFGARNSQAQAICPEATTWVEHHIRAGVFTSFRTYIDGIREDMDLRQTWKSAWEKHAEAMSDFELLCDEASRLRYDVANGVAKA